MSARVLKFHSYTITSLADQVSRRTGIPYSTVKWNLRTLMSMGLITGGTEMNKGALAKMTGPGTMLAEHLQVPCDE